MDEFKFYVPVTVRYSDLDAQWHVNHTRFLIYMEQARLGYLQKLELFDGKAFLDLRAIIADVHVSYLAPIVLGQQVRVGTRTLKIGKKSIKFEYILEDAETLQPLAKGEVISVAYNFREQVSVSIPQEWRERISEFEGRSY